MSLFEDFHCLNILLGLYKYVSWAKHLAKFNKMLTLSFILPSFYYETFNLPKMLKEHNRYTIWVYHHLEPTTVELGDKTPIPTELVWGENEVSTTRINSQVVLPTLARAHIWSSKNLQGLKCSREDFCSKLRDFEFKY